MSKLLTASKAAPSVNNVMDAAFNYLPVHEQCALVRIDLQTPAVPDVLLNTLFPETSAAQCHCDAGKAAEINRCLDVLGELFEPISSRSQ